MTIKDIAQLGKHIAAQHGWPAAKAFKAYEMSDADRAVLSQCALDLLKLFPATVRNSAQMSAALAVSLERRMQAPIQVVSGALLVEGEAVFAPSSDGPGHTWVMLGAYVVDMALFRAAYSADGPARLARHVDLVFGPGKGVYVAPWKQTQQAGLRYDPRHVLSAEEVTRLMGEAYQTIKG